MTGTAFGIVVFVGSVGVVAIVDIVVFVQKRRRWGQFESEPDFVAGNVENSREYYCYYYLRGVVG